MPSYRLMRDPNTAKPEMEGMAPASCPRMQGLWLDLLAMQGSWLGKLVGLVSRHASMTGKKSTSLELVSKMAVGIKMVQMINTKLQALPYHYIGGTVVSFSRRGRRALMMELELAAPYYTGLQTLNPSPHISPEFQCRPRVLKPGFLSSSPEL